MSDVSSSADAWFTRLEPVQPPRRPGAPRRRSAPGRSDRVLARRPRLAARPACAVGFPVDEGVRRNHGRTGAAAAPFSIRRWLYHLTPTDCQEESVSPTIASSISAPPLRGRSEDAQRASWGAVVAACCKPVPFPSSSAAATRRAYGHFLGYVGAGWPPASSISMPIWMCAPAGRRGSSGTPFRQALEHPHSFLRGGTMSASAPSRKALAGPLDYVHERGGTVRWFRRRPFPLREYSRRNISAWPRRRKIFT